MIQLSITNNKGTFDMTQLAQTITWSGDYQQCARTLQAGIVSSYIDKNIPAVACELGNGVTLTQGKRILFDGFIFERQKDTGSSIMDITCYDRGVYLKRNEATYTFPNTAPEEIVKRICTDFSIPTGSIVTTGLKISRNFIGVSLYNIMQTAYTLAAEKTGKQYMIRFDGDKLNVIEKAVTDETLVIKGGSNLMSASTSESITDMVNQVTIYDSKDVLIKKMKNPEDIKLYGLMQSYLKQPDEEDITQKAEKILSDNRISQKIVVNNLGNIANITGGTVVIKEPYTGIHGLFYIDNDVHTWKLGQYYNKLTVNFKSIMDKQEAGSLPNKTGEKTGTGNNLNKPGGVSDGK
jgi:hypothetical protein